MELHLKNGLRIVYEKVPHVRSVAVGVFAGAGSRLEMAQENGICHYIEHMLFKGTARRTAKDIACEMDAIGGNLNAYTTREYTCFYAKAVDEEIEKLFDILSDMYLFSAFSEEDVELERGVILEEINMYEDSPEDVAIELLSRVAWGDNPLGYSIAGTLETVSAITREDLYRFWKKHYTAKNTVIAVCGNFDAGHLHRLAEKYFGQMESGMPYTMYRSVPFSAGKAMREKDIEQAHICIGWPGIPQNSEARYAAAILSNAFGGGMSSRLFQKIREEKGLVYSIYAAPDAFKNAGMLLVYAGTSPENAQKVRQMILDEAADIQSAGLTEAELVRGRNQLRSSYILGLESVSGRMQTIGRSTLLYDTVKSADEVLLGIQNVSASDIKALAEQILSADRAETVVCPKECRKG